MDETGPELAGTLYVDGHLRLYHSTQTRLPRRHAAWQRLCLRGATDYRGNDALGQRALTVRLIKIAWPLPAKNRD
jgi:hypothetical protein